MALTPTERLDVLRRWAESRTAEGFGVPGEAALADVAQAASFDDVKVTPGVAAWLPTLEFLHQQIRMGVRHPDIPSELTMPVSAVGANAGSEGASQEDRFDALREWRDGQVARGREGIDALKEFKLRGIARRTTISGSQVRSMLSAGEAQFADEIGAVLDRLDAASEGRSAGDDGASASPSAVAPSDGGSGSGSESTAGDPGPEPATSATTPTPPAGPHSSESPRPDPRVFEAASPSARPVDRDSAQPDSVDSAGFAPYALIPAGNPLVALAGTQAADRAFTFTWEPFTTPHPTTLYRVVSSDEFPPYSPDLADVVGATTLFALRDEREFTTAVRHVQVWANSGADDAAARAAQPALHASGAFVAQPNGIEIREDEGRVIGQWTAWPGTGRVLVYRVPVARAAMGLSNPQYQILADSTNLGGFVDTQADRGARYLYAIVAETVVDGVTQQSVPSARDVLVSDVLEPVRDLRIEASGTDDDRRFTLEWTAPPGGQVVVYRTQHAPQPGADREALPESALAQTLLADEDRLAHPIEIGEDGARGMTDVPWPRTWTRAYFTPVTLLGGQAFVGTTVSHAGTRSIKAAKIVERVSKQILTFAWPEGAASVQIFGGVTGGDPADAIAQNRGGEVSLEQYKQAGGFTFPYALPSKGCDVHLVPVAFHGGNSVQGTPTTVSYPGLIRLRYELEASRSLMRSVTGVSFTVHAVAESVDRPVVCILVYNAERFPLSMTDGVALTVAAEELGGMPVRRAQLPNVQRDAPGITWKTPADTWKTEAGSSGFVRLFVEVPVDALGSVALLDPAASSLRIGKAGRFGV